MLPSRTKPAPTVASECRILGVSTTDSWRDIKKAYARLARDLHPDMYNKDDTGSAEKTVDYLRIKEAYEFLKRNQSRLGVAENKSIRSERRQHPSGQLQGRMITIESWFSKLSRRGYVDSDLLELVLDAREAFNRFNSGLRPISIAEVESIFDKVDQAIKRLYVG